MFKRNGNAQSDCLFAFALKE
jgi:hypothetical protein